MALGEDEAVRFFVAFGGAELYIARDPKGRGMVERELGVETARRLADLADRVHLPRRVPMPKPWLAQLWKSQGLPVAEIARRLHASDVAVRRWLAAVPASTDAAPDSRQMRLF
ncbi:helix-turn-helix domain-containing protein [Gemmobacter straminiformis]|uniref:Helix-turn-helix domain-containing protein n=2 Tax=Paragemmobacter straminiformis TaxID=2045119 RepID=A0A842I3D7_9RHOB|nr:helix-turn-helix domain-containing protein [Gemmobacter straminiformis]MBC2834682.1 helix-turn-helix domain-containing protein [Gemmobacter straminiformis]